MREFLMRPLDGFRLAPIEGVPLGQHDVLQRI
jgi:hypothetical protein